MAAAPRDASSSLVQLALGGLWVWAGPPCSSFKQSLPQGAGFAAALQCARRARPHRRWERARSAWALELVSPLDIRFTQRNCSAWFRDGTNMGTLLQEVMACETFPESIKHLRIVWDGEHWYSLDNRRLAVLRLACIFHDRDLRVPVQAFEGSPQQGQRKLARSGKFHTRCKGARIFVNDADVLVGLNAFQCQVL